MLITCAGHLFFFCFLLYSSWPFYSLAVLSLFFLRLSFFSIFPFVLSAFSAFKYNGILHNSSTWAKFHSLTMSIWLLCKKAIKFILSFLPSLMFPFVLSFNHAPCALFTRSLPYFRFNALPNKYGKLNFIRFNTLHNKHCPFLCEFSWFHSFFIAFCSLHISLRSVVYIASINFLTKFSICKLYQIECNTKSMKNKNGIRNSLFATHI